MAKVEEEVPNSSQSPSPPQQQEKMNIYLKVTKTVALKVTRSDTIRRLKAAMREKEGVPENFQELYYGGKCLKDDGNLVDCGIHENSTLHLVLQTSEVVKLIVRISSVQKSIEIEAKRHDTVEKIKLVIQAKEGIHSDKYTLLYAGKLLENSRTLSSLGIKDEATFYLVFNPREVVTLSVKLPAGEIVKTEVKIWYTVRDVKEIVGGMFGFPASDHNLFYGGKQLVDSFTLASYNINEESILEILPLRFQIFVRLLTGKIITLDVCQHDTVSCVKSKISQKDGDLIHPFVLTYAGKRLGDDQDLAQLGIEKSSTLNIVLRMSTARLIRSMKLSEINGAHRLPGSITIGNLKQLIKVQLNKAVKEVHLGGQALEDDKTMADYGLQKDTELTVTI